MEQSLVVKHAYLSSSKLPVRSNQCGFSPLTSLISKTFPSAELHECASVLVPTAKSLVNVYRMAQNSKGTFLPQKDKFSFLLLN